LADRVDSHAAERRSGRSQRPRPTRSDLLTVR